MLFDFFLAAVFMVSASALWYLVSLKIPELVAISDSVIVERLHEDSARVRIFLLHFKTFYRQGLHWVWLRKLCEKVCHRLHIFLLRADNAVVALLRRIRTGGDLDKVVSSGALSVKEEYWFQLRQDQEVEKKEENPVFEIARASRARPERVHEVRLRKNPKAPDQ